MKVRGPEIVIALILIGLAVLVGYAYFVTRPPEEPGFEPLPPPEEPVAKKPAPGQARPVIEVSELKHDFGTIEPDQVLDHTFPIKNVGDATLTIDGMRSGCGCVTLEMSSLEIPPDGSADLVAELDPQHYGGPSPNISAYVYTNDPERKVTVFNVAAEITPEFVIEPEKLDFGTVLKGTEKSRTFRLRQTWREPVKIAKLDTSPEGVGAFYSEVTGSNENESVSPKAEYEVEVRLGADVPAGNLAGYVNVHTNIKRRRIVRVPVKAFVRGGVSTVPKLFLFAARDSTQNLGTIDIYADGPFGIAEIISDVDGVVWEVTSGGRRPTQSVAAKLEPGAQPGERSGSVTFKLNQAGVEQVVVPVAGVVFEEEMQG